MHGAERTGKALAAALFLAWSGAFVFQTSIVARDGRRYFCLFDDAMVAMRYAWNLSHGHGLVWNPGERVEGYTSLLMALLMSAATAAFDKVHAVLAIQVAGALVVVATALLTARVADLAFPGRHIGLACFACVLAYYPLGYWSLMGMEAGLLAFLVTASLALAVGYAREPRRPRLLWLGALLALAFLTRPDSALLALPLFAFAGRTAFATAQGDGWRRAVLGYGAVVFAQMLFRLFYYGHPLPNTYYLKLTGIPLASRVADGAAFLAPYLGSHALLLLGALLGAWRGRRPESRLLASIPLVAIGYQVWVGGDPWPYWRLLAPAFPALAVLFVAAALPLLKRGPWAAAACVAGLFAANRPFLPEIFFAAPPFQVQENTNNVDTALAIEALTTGNATVGGCWAGAIPYYTGRRAIDFLGKSDARIARRPPDLSGRISWAGMRSVPGHNKYDLEYSLVERRPTWAERFRWGGQDLTDWGRKHYVTVAYRGLQLHLDAESGEVRWEEIRPWMRAP